MQKKSAGYFAYRQILMFKNILREVYLITDSDNRFDDHHNQTGQNTIAARLHINIGVCGNREFEKFGKHPDFFLFVFHKFFARTSTAAGY